MTRLALALLVAWLLTLIPGAGVAAARELTPTERAQITDVAGRAFPDSPCYQQVQIAFVHTVVADQRDALTIAAVKTGEWNLQGYADGLFAGTCKVQVESDLDPAVACTVATHEAGHLDGLAHGSSALMGTPDTPDRPGGDFGTYVWPACMGMVTLHLDDAYQWLYDRTSTSTDVTCARRSASQAQCVTAHGRVRKTWRVWAVGDHQFKGARIA